MIGDLRLSLEVKYESIFSSLAPEIFPTALLFVVMQWGLDAKYLPHSTLPPICIQISWHTYHFLNSQMRALGKLRQDPMIEGCFKQRKSMFAQVLHLFQIPFTVVGVSTDRINAKLGWSRLSGRLC